MIFFPILLDCRSIRVLFFLFCFLNILSRVNLYCLSLDHSKFGKTNIFNKYDLENSLRPMSKPYQFLPTSRETLKWFLAFLNILNNDLYHK